MIVLHRGGSWEDSLRRLAKQGVQTTSFLRSNRGGRQSNRLGSMLWPPPLVEIVRLPKIGEPDMPELIKRLAQSLKISPLCSVQDRHSPSSVAGLWAIPHLAIYRPGDPVAGRDLNPVSMLIFRRRPKFKAGDSGSFAPRGSLRDADAVSPGGGCGQRPWPVLRTRKGKSYTNASMYDAFGRDWRDSRFAVCDALETSEFHVFRDVFFRSEPVAVDKGKRAARRR